MWKWCQGWSSMAGSPVWGTRMLQRGNWDIRFHSKPRVLRSNPGWENRWKWDFLLLYYFHSPPQCEWGCERVWYVHQCMFCSPETSAWLICRVRPEGGSQLRNLLCEPTHSHWPFPKGGLPKHSNFKNMWLIFPHNVHFPWIHSFALFGLKEYSRFQNLEHEDEYHLEAQHTGVEFLRTEALPTAASLWTFRSQRRRPYLCVPHPCLRSQAFLCTEAVLPPTMWNWPDWGVLGGRGGLRDASYLGRHPELSIFLQQLLSLLCGLPRGGMCWEVIFTCFLDPV